MTGRNVININYFIEWKFNSYTREETEVDTQAWYKTEIRTSR